MKIFNLAVQRFAPTHPLFSDRKIKHEDRFYQANFGQLINEFGFVLNYTMERRDTLIPCGRYDYSLYYSPVNKHVVILLHNVPGHSFIELHIANYPYEVKGCTALGKIINVKTPMLQSSGLAFNQLMYLINTAFPNAKHTIVQGNKIIPGDILGTITYEQLK